MFTKRESGDYQTPAAFADKICEYLKYRLKLSPNMVLEPTCGEGNFLSSSMIFNAETYYGYELNANYCDFCRKRFKDERVHIVDTDFFAVTSFPHVERGKKMLVIGNPPWVTNSYLSKSDAFKALKKSNIKGLSGLEAKTGESNFDICESIILRLISEYKDTDTVLAMLCKKTVARNIFRELVRNAIPFLSCSNLEFESKKIFKINADACLLVIQLSEKPVFPKHCDVRDFDCPEKIKSCYGYRNDLLYSDVTIGGELDIDGTSCFEWRQGVKHDCSAVMELSVVNGATVNGRHEPVKIEETYVFPLVKSSMFKKPIVDEFSKYVIVTQRRIGQNTTPIAQIAPHTWDYLQKNIACFEQRRSSIYHGAPRFAMFGVGDYSFSRYKVGISGFYKQPLFSLMYSADSRPVMTDDTSYFISFNAFDEAYVAMLVLNSRTVTEFLRRIAFVDAKRPFTKKLLKRIDFGKALQHISLSDLLETEKRLGLPRRVDEKTYNKFVALTCRKSHGDDLFA